MSPQRPPVSLSVPSENPFEDRLFGRPMDVHDSALVAVRSDKSQIGWQEGQHLYYLLSGTVTTRSEGHHSGHDSGPADPYREGESIDVYLKVRENGSSHLVPGVPLTFLRHHGWLHRWIRRLPNDKEIAAVKTIFENIRQLVVDHIDTFAKNEAAYAKRHSKAGIAFASPSFDNKPLVHIMSERKTRLISRWTRWFNDLAYSKNTAGLAQLTYDFSKAAEQLISLFELGDDDVISELVERFKDTIKVLQAQLLPFGIKPYELYPISLVKLVEEDKDSKLWDAIVPLSVRKDRILSTLPGWNNGDGWTIDEQKIKLVGPRMITFRSSKSPEGAETIISEWEIDVAAENLDHGNVAPLTCNDRGVLRTDPNDDKPGRHYWSPTLEVLDETEAAKAGLNSSANEVLVVRPGGSTTDWEELGKFVHDATEIWFVADKLRGNHQEVLQAKKAAHALHLRARDLQRIAHKFGFSHEITRRIRASTIDKVAQQVEAARQHSRQFKPMWERSGSESSITAGKFSIHTDGTRATNEFDPTAVADLPYQDELGRLTYLFRAHRSPSGLRKIDLYTGTEVAIYKKNGIFTARVNEVVDEYVSHIDDITFPRQGSDLDFTFACKKSSEGKEDCYLIAAKDTHIWIYPLDAKFLAGISNPLDAAKAASHPGRIRSIKFHPHHGLLTVLTENSDGNSSNAKIWSFGSPTDLKEVGNIPIPYPAKTEWDLRVESNAKGIFVVRSLSNSVELWNVINTGKGAYSLKRAWTYTLAPEEGSKVTQAGVLKDVVYISTNDALVPVEITNGKRTEDIRSALRRYHVTTHWVVNTYPDVNFVLVADGNSDYKLHDLNGDVAQRQANELGFNKPVYKRNSYTKDYHTNDPFL